jgi:hypothetical protein
LLGEVKGGEYDEMLETGLGQFAVELQPRGVIGQAPVRAGAEPSGEPPLLGDCGEGEISFSRVQRELLMTRLPTEFLDKQLSEIPALQ